MTARHVALLRGINLGRAKRVGMADLRDLVAALGYRDVRTFLNSGNVIFTAPVTVRGDAGPRIQEALGARLGVSSRVTVLTAAEMTAVVQENPFRQGASDPSRLLVAFLATPEDCVRLQHLPDRAWSPEALALGSRAAYIWCPDGIVHSSAVEAVGRAAGDAVTMRNWRTVTKLHALLGEGA